MRKRIGSVKKMKSDLTKRLNFSWQTAKPCKFGRGIKFIFLTKNSICIVVSKRLMRENIRQLKFRLMRMLQDRLVREALLLLVLEPAKVLCPCFKRCRHFIVLGHSVFFKFFSRSSLFEFFLFSSKSKRRNL